MLRGVLIGVCVLVVVVFAYVGYSTYATRSVSGAEVYADGNGAGSGRRGADLSEDEGDTSRPASRGSQPAMSTSGQKQRTAEAMEDAPGNPQDTASAAAATDSINPNPPNGMTFGGSGHFQLYRQGDLTWRMNTDTGETCVIFATNEQWRKPSVFRSGCRGK